MVKITRQNWPAWVVASTILATLIGGFFSALICKGLNSSEAAGWMQAIGSVAAIVGAGYGIRAQMRHAEKQALKDSADDQRNVVVSVIAELRVYNTALDDIQTKISESTSVIFGEMLQLIFPSASFRFPIYVANAAKIWAVSDDDLRSKLIGVYAELDMLFALLDRNSAIAQMIPHGEVPSGEIAAQLKGMLPVIQAQLDKLVPDLRDVKVRLETQVQVH